MLGDGAARGATPGSSARRSRKIHRVPPHHPRDSPRRANTLALLVPPIALVHKVLIRRFTPAIPTNAVCTSVLFFVISLLTLLSFPFPFFSRPAITFFYRILYFSRHPCSPRALRASSSTYLSPRVVDLALTPAAIFTPGTVRSGYSTG